MRYLCMPSLYLEEGSHCRSSDWITWSRTNNFAASCNVADDRATVRWEPQISAVV
jgi:hypothetical protein